VFPAAELAVKPENLSFEAAAALPIAGLTARVAVEQTGIRAGQRILIHGAGGGVGHLALQIERSYHRDRIMGHGIHRLHETIRPDRADRSRSKNVLVDLLTPPD
jgi:NADPH:quinone reductase-like Zn-dependent oxidoreductase